MVDDRSLYSKKLLGEFEQLGVPSVLYGPITSPATKPQAIMETMARKGVRVWSQNLFPLQILRRAIKDRIQLAHIQFEFYGIHSYGPLYSSIGVPILLVLLRLARIKSVVTLHAVLPNQGRELNIVRETAPNSKRVPGVLLGVFLIFTYKLIALCSNRILVHAQVFKRRLIEEYNIKPSKVDVIPHGVDISPKSRSPSSSRWDQKSDPTILYFGVISPRKGIENLLSAFAILLKQTDCTLLVAGSSPPYYRGYETSVKELAAKLGIDPKTKFLGTVKTELAHELLEEATFLVLPYAYAISASGALSWALAHRVPVIVSENDYFKEEMSSYEFGLLVEPGNPRALADAMQTMITQRGLRTSFSEKACEAASSRSWTNVAEQTLGSYRTLFHTN